MAEIPALASLTFVLPALPDRPPQRYPTEPAPYRARLAAWVQVQRDRAAHVEPLPR